MFVINTEESGWPLRVLKGNKEEGPCPEAVGGFQVEVHERDVDWAGVWYLTPGAERCGADP